MRGQRSWGLTALAVAAALFLGVGCVESSSVHGGGWVAAEAGSQDKVTFGLDLVCDIEQQQAAGTFTLHDKAAGVKIHATARPELADGVFCGPPGESPMGAYVLEYRDSDEGPALGEATAILQEDVLQVWVTTGPLAGYAKTRPLEGGNISFEPEE